MKVVIVHAELCNDRNCGQCKSADCYSFPVSCRKTTAVRSSRHQHLMHPLSALSRTSFTQPAPCLCLPFLCSKPPLDTLSHPYTSFHGHRTQSRVTFGGDTCSMHTKPNTRAVKSMNCQSLCSSSYSNILWWDILHESFLLYCKRSQITILS